MLLRNLIRNDIKNAIGFIIEDIEAIQINVEAITKQLIFITNIIRILVIFY